MAKAKKIRWGILGCGNIAKKFANAIPDVKDAELVACGSRSQEKADTFGAEFKIPHRHGSYKDLAADPDVDCIYVATPHTKHKEDALLALKAGKHVLCEKPFAVNAAEAKSVLQAAKRRKLFCMEAMWTRFLPVMVEVRKLLEKRAIGELRMVQASFAFRAGWNPQSRLLNPELAGGGLLDVGVYTISFAHMVLGSPNEVLGAAQIGETGVDEQAAMILKYKTGPLATLTCGVRTTTEHNAVIYGTDGFIRIPQFWNARKFDWGYWGKDVQTVEPTFEGNGFNYEIAEVNRCVKAGKLESDVMPHAATLEVMRMMDDLRSQWGLEYPSEK